MFCFSLKGMKLRAFMAVVGIILVCIVCFFVRLSARSTPTSAPAYVSGMTHDDRVAFLQTYGWTVRDDPVEVADVMIPLQFGDVYTHYNAIQLAQGFDLQPFAGRSVKKWVYAVTDYPGYSQSEVFVRATLLVCQGQIIGGDVCSVELNGFMHGFAYEAGNG